MVPAGELSPATQPRTDAPAAPTSLPSALLVTLLDADEPELFEVTGCSPPDAACGAGSGGGAGTPGEDTAVCTAAERSIRSSTGFEICCPSQSNVTWLVSSETILNSPTVSPARTGRLGSPRFSAMMARVPLGNPSTP